MRCFIWQMKISMGTRQLYEKVHLVKLLEYPLWKDSSRKEMTRLLISLKIPWRWRLRSSQDCPCSHAGLSSFILEPMMLHSQYIKLISYEISLIRHNGCNFIWSKIFMGNAQTRQNIAVTILKIVSIFLCSSYFHHAADISPLLALFYDNPKCMKFFE